jgi:hypothetical protein
MFLTRSGGKPDLLYPRKGVKYLTMKEAGMILLVLLMTICMTANDAWAGTQVYITFSIASGVFIGVIGVCFQAVFQQRIAQKQEERNQLAVARKSALQANEPDLLPRQVAGADLMPTYFDPFRENRQAVHPDLEVNLFTFRW